jgi:hypothetical protein
MPPAGYRHASHRTVDETVRELDGVLDGEIHPLAAGRGDEVRRVAREGQAPVLHRRGDSHPQVEEGAVAERDAVHRPPASRDSLA